jgi:chromosome segregation ATPase
MQEMKKGASSDQSEIKDLKHKLRMLEMEREKLSSKQPEILDLKKTLATAEAKRKEEAKDRDRRIAELEKQLSAEQRKREAAETKVKDAAQSTEEETKTVKATLTEMQARLQDALDESRAAKDKLASVEGDVEYREDALLQQLEQHRSLLVAVTQQYGALASQSVSSDTHNNLRHAHNALQFRQFRLERKLGNSEAQVVELTQLFRQVKEDNNMLKSILRAALQELSFLRKSDASSPPSGVATENRELTAIVDHIHARMHKERLQLADIDTNTHKLMSAFYRLKSHDLRFASSVLAKEYDIAQALAEQHASDLASTLASHEVIATRVESIQKEKTSLEEQLKASTAEMDALKIDTAILEARVGELQEEIKQTVVKHVNDVKKDKELVQRLTTTVQKNRMAEEALRAEIEQYVVTLLTAR